MTDGYFDLHNQGSVVKRPITNAGRVAGNGRLAQSEYEDRQAVGAANSPYPFSDMSDTSFRMLPREVALAYKTRSFTSGSDGLVNVFSVLNGVGHDGKSLKQLRGELTFAGLVGSDGAIYDTEGNYPANPDVALILGGTTTIVNTGNQYIRNGDYIMWDLPEPSAASASSTRDRRILVSTLPYRPSEQGPTASAIIEHMKTRGAPRDTPLGGACSSLRNFVRIIAVMALKAFLSSGLVAFDNAAFGITPAARTRREANAAAWDALGDRVQEGHLLRVARALRAADIRDMDQSSELRVQAGARGLALSTYLDSMLIGMTPLVNRTEGSNAIPSGDAGTLLRGQLGVLDNLLAGIHQAQEHTRSRVFCRAITPAAPGQPLDVNVGAYSV